MNINEERIKTNLLMLDYFYMWDDFHYKSINDTKTLRYYNLISNLIDSQLGAGIKWLDSKEAEKYFKGESVYQTELFQSLEEEWDEILEEKYPSVEALLSEVYRRGKAKGYADMRERIKYTKQDKLALAFVQDYNFGLIQSIGDDVRNQIKKTIIAGVLAGDHPNTVAPKILNIAETRLEGSTFSPRQRATMIAKTEISRVQNTGILQSYVNEGYTQVKILTAEDDSVCTLCLDNAFEFNKDDEIIYSNRGKEKVHSIKNMINKRLWVPLHPNCRCTYISVWESKSNDDNDDGEEYSEEKITVDTTIKRNSAKKPSSNVKNGINYDEIKTPEDIAEYFDFQYQMVDGVHYFWDSKNQTHIVIDNYFVEGFGAKYLMDSSNSGKCKYDMKEIIKIYDEANTILKKATNEILFTEIDSNVRVGSSSPWLIDGVTKRIKIYQNAFFLKEGQRGNVAQTMYHEMGHCLDYSLVDEKYHHIFLHPEKYNKKEKNEMVKKYAHGISNEELFIESCEEDDDFYASKYAKDKESISENWADTISMIPFLTLEDKSLAFSKDYGGNFIDLESWSVRNSEKFIYALRKLRGLSEKDFIYKSLYINFENIIKHIVREVFKNEYHC